MVTTNRESMFDVKNLADDIEQAAKELRFQANQAKRDPDEAAYYLLEATKVELYKLERLIKKARKTLMIL